MNNMMIPVFILAVGFLLDFLFSDPRSPWYPTNLFGRFASLLEVLCRFRFGNGVLCGLLAWFFAVATIVWFASFLAHLAMLISPFAGIAAAAACFYFSITLRGMFGSSAEVRGALLRRDLYGAKFALSRFVNRNTDQLAESGIIGMAIEGIGENLLKNLNSVCFWGVVGYWAAGIPGFAGGAVFARAVTLLDLCWGYRTEQYRKFGKMTAWIDDAVHWIPARLTVLSTAIGALFLGLRPFAVLKNAWSFRKNHPSPNTGLIFASFAGALDVTLEKTENHDVIGNGSKTPDCGDLSRAEHLALVSSLTFTAIVLGVCICLLKN